MCATKGNRNGKTIGNSGGKGKGTKGNGNNFRNLKEGIRNKGNYQNYGQGKNGNKGKEKEKTGNGMKYEKSKNKHHNCMGEYPPNIYRIYIGR